MKKKINSTILLSGACIFAAIVALFVRSQLSTPAPVQQQVQIPVPKKMVLVADKDLHPGDFIDAGSVRWEETDKPVSRNFYFLSGQDTESQLFGATVRKPVLAGTALNNNLVVRANEPGFISAVLGKGMRAISIPTNAVASNSGLVNAGDRVDIILSLRKDDQQETTDPNAPAIPRLAAQTIVNDLRVLALNNNTDSNADVRPRLDVESENTNSNNRVRQALYQTVTVEVTPEQAEVLAVAKEVGLLHLSLRSGADSLSENQQAGRVTTLSDSTDIYDGVGSGYQVKLFRGTQKENKTFPAQ